MTRGGFLIGLFGQASFSVGVGLGQCILVGMTMG